MKQKRQKGPSAKAAAAVTPERTRPPRIAAPGPSDRPLSGKVALVTGGAIRVGRAIVRDLAEAGASVAVHYHRSAAPAQRLVAELGSRARAFRADLRDPSAVAALVAEAKAAFGRLDVLVSSAAAFGRQPLAQVTVDDWRSMMALNVDAPFFLAQAAAPELARRRGVIVNILDVAAFHAWKGYAAYGASKAALAMLTRGLALELAPAVRVAGVAPGTVQFPDTYDPAARAAVLGRIPLGLEGRPEDVARAVRFIVLNDYVTGSVISVDGGRGAGAREIL